ncbi:glycosyltransferase [Actinocatenispora sera]|uniref:glycosyltransferase n=1 Tax=Actinocatenispora sera TaxID=390989 RepID=UPI0033D84EC4
MTDALFVVRDGGGTAPAELRLARRLVAHGHRVRVAGPPSIAPLASGLPFHPLTELAPAPLCTALLDRRELLAAVDVVVADCLLYGALLAATVAGVRSAALMPTVYLADRLAGSALAAQPRWATVLAEINAARRAVRLPAVDSVTDQILAADRVLVLTSRAFELPSVHPPAHVEYVGPQLADATGDAWRAPAGDRPLVLASLSTEEQNQLELLRRLVAVLGRLPVRGLVTVGPAVDPARLNPPDNVIVERYVPHAAVLDRAALVITHAGHGTVLAALRAGVPLVCLPMGRDQHDVAARVSYHGAGIVLPADAGTAELARAVRRGLAELAYATAARRLATAIAAEDPDRAVAAVVAAAAATSRNGADG